MIPTIGPNQNPGRQATSIESNVIEPPVGNLKTLMFESTNASAIDIAQKAIFLAVKLIFELEPVM